MCRKLTMLVLGHREWVNTLPAQLLGSPGNAAMQVLTAVLLLIGILAAIQDNLHRFSSNGNPCLDSVFSREKDVCSAL